MRDRKREKHGEIHVLRTQDGGLTWKNITGNLPTGMSLRDIAADRGNPDVVFVSVFRRRT